MLASSVKKYTNVVLLGELTGYIILALLLDHLWKLIQQ